MRPAVTDSRTASTEGRPTGGRKSRTVGTRSCVFAFCLALVAVAPGLACGLRFGAADRRGADRLPGVFQGWVLDARVGDSERRFHSPNGNAGDSGIGHRRRADAIRARGSGRDFAGRRSNRRTELRYFKPGQTAGDVTVRVRQGRGVVAERRLSAGRLASPLPADQPLVVTCGSPLPVAEALSLAGRLSGADGSTPHLDRAEQLPDEWLGYEGVNVLVLPTSRPAPLAEMSDRQVGAIQQWVRMGGRLVFCVGSRGAEVLDPNGPWAKLAPGRFSSVVPVRSGSALETYSGSAEPLDVAAFGSAVLRMTRLQDVRGKVELSDTAADGLRPIIVRYSYGLGMVLFVAYDLDTPPLANWDGNATPDGEAAGAVAEHGATMESTEQRTGRVAHEGFRDLVGQLRTALDDFPGVTLVAFSWIAGLVLLYIVLIGPGDYFLLGRVIGRMHWTWVTFPALVLAFGGLAVWLNLNLKGDRLQVNQAEVVDVDAQSGVLRGTSWFHVYSPATRAFEFEMDTEEGPFAGRQDGDALSWQGLPGPGLGGMSSQIAGYVFPRALCHCAAAADAADANPTHADRRPGHAKPRRAVVGRNGNRRSPGLAVDGGRPAERHHWQSAVRSN